MKATGIVRRIDDLGRVVIPKEIRKTLRLRDGDALEIFTDSDGEVIFKKYSPIGEMASFASAYAEAINMNASIPVVISDNDRVVAASGVAKREVFDRPISKEIEELLEQRRAYSSAESEQSIYPIEGSQRKASIVYPIIAAGDAVGSVIVLDDGKTPTQTEIKLTGVAASFLGKQMEE
ncbi:MAG: AbrB/MazE/SpoVT family DNA-binding domain-containing protein [Ruminococcaceae bacterium]|nr:AbrB/MazE/SpoVT family DNA-binding domain-containing protein [Oscillospiraceae bacterium]